MRNALLLAVTSAAILIFLGTTAPRAQSAAPKFNLVVVCVKCIPDAMPQEAYNAGNILLDQNTGDLWFYPALSPNVKPRKLGRFTEIGKPLVDPDK